MRTSDSFPVVLALAAFVLMFLGQSTYERLLDAWIVGHVAPRFGGIAAEVLERLSAVAVAAAFAIYVTGGLYVHLRREFIRSNRSINQAADPRAT
jgi:hypothetical protein